MNSQPPSKNAVAIAYETGSSAPRVVAKGKGLIAEQIMARAREHGVHVHESKELVSLLMQVDLDKDIPATLYLAVAELLAWLYHIENGKVTTFTSVANTADGIDRNSLTLSLPPSDFDSNN